ncbi:hypothetical protein H6F75_00150 [Nodosilinea sp. FACHB-131]|uniref:hypothetical protein n=1 Tax=Cyanophyceae TaxID=3028117 RepID=UPI00168263C1|nr:hypothetical protein [Nodosilinea sp. FACHB-131]MBD1871881.1 hypothetical protein [Nodosilinea sp. FACHB-131]
MNFWNFISSLFDLSRSASSSSTSSKSKQSKSAASKSKTADSQQSSSTTAPPATPVETFAKAKVKSPTTRTDPIASSIPNIEIGAYSTFSPVSIDDAGICLRCTPEIPNGDDADLFIDLGIDFGTRYTKVCFRNSDSNQTSIVTFDNGSVNLEQALVSSQIAILDRGEILTGLTSNEWEASQWPITTTIGFIKMRLAYLDLPQDNPHWPPSVDALDSSETIENLSAYFLGRLIARSRNWIQTTQPDLFKKRKVGWVLKVGAPVEYWHGPAIDRFERVLKLAWALSFTPMVRGGDMVTLPQLNQCMNHVRVWVEQHPDLDCFAKPEIAAAVWAHIRAVGSREGFFVFSDVGEGTTEGASFRFYRDNGEDRISFYSGFVRSLGVATLSQQLQDELALDSKAVRDALLSWNLSSDNANQKNILKSQTRKYFQRIVASVIVTGFNRYRSACPHLWKSEIGSILKVFLGGGGSQISFFRHGVESTYTDFGHQRSIPDLPPYKTDNVPEPEDLDLQNLDTSAFNRFSIAYGLSIAEGQFPEFDFPDDTDFPKPPPRPELNNHSDMKDFC